MPKINLELATKIAQRAIAEGAERKVLNMSCVVTDAGGHVRLAMRADGQGIFGIETATAKATSALGFGRSTLLQTPSFDAAAVAGINGATHGRFVPLGGGVVIVDDDDEPIGAVGVSGGAPATDDEIVRAALVACGLKCRK